MRTFVLLIVLMGGISIVQMWPTKSQQWVGVITDIEPGKWIAVTNEMSDPDGFRIALSNSTEVDGDPSRLRRDVRVRVFYSSTGGGAVARRVSILPDPPRR